MPYTEEQLRRREEALAKQQLIQTLPKEEEKDAPPPEEMGVGEIFAKSLRKGTAGVSSSFGQTGEFMAESRGKEDRAEKRAKRVEEARKIAEKEVYVAKYGETGASQFKNITDPKWWASTLGEALPGSAPFLAGAAAGGTAGMYFGPYGALVGAALGGGTAVFAQEFGSAYNEYLGENPNDVEGAESYALKKSGLSAVINAATVPLAMLGRSVEPLKRAIIQAVLQGGAESADSVSGNILVRDYIDPNMDITTGLARGIVGELAFESPALASGVRGRFKRAESKEERIKQRKEREEEMDALLDSINEEEVLNEVMAKRREQNPTMDMTLIRPRVLEEIQEGNFASLDVVQLKEIADKLEINTLPIDNAETLFNKIKEGKIAKQKRRLDSVEAKSDLQSELTFEDRFKEQKDILNEMSGQQVFDYIQREFDMGSPEKTWDQFAYWAERQGDFSFIPAAFESEYYNNQIGMGENVSADITYGPQIINALAHASATRFHREQASTPINYSLGGKGQFRDYVEQFTDKYSREQLEQQFEDLFSRGTASTMVGPAQSTEDMSNFDIASVIAERMMVLENLRLKKQQTEELVSEVSVAEQETEGADRKGVGLMSNPRTLNELSDSGNAVSAKVTVYGEDGTEQGNIFFERELLGETEVGDILNRSGIKRDYSSEELTQIGNLGKMIAVSFRGTDYSQHDWQGENNWKGKTVDGILETINGAELTEMELVGSARPVDQTNVLTKTRGKLSSWFRPAGKMGQVATSKQKQTEAALRVHQQVAKEMAHDLEVSIIKAAQAAVPKKFGVFKTKLYLEAEAKIRNQVRAFLKQTGAPIELSKEEQQAFTKEIARLEKNRATGLAVNEQDAIDNDAAISELKAYLIGNKSVNLAVQDLPTKQLQDMARKARTGIDTLTNRILDEFPPEMLGDTQDQKGLTRQILEDQLNSYAVNSFAMFETKMGFNPKLSKTFLRSKAANKLYDNAVIAVLSMNSGNPNWEGEKGQQKAIKVVDSMIDQTYFSSASDMATLPGVMKVKNDSKTAGLPSGPKLLQERFKIPFALRKLMGEITDPTLIVAGSLSRIAKLIETQNFYRDLLRINSMPGEMMFAQQRTGPFQHQISLDDEFNPLRGMWTTKDIAQTLGTDKIPGANSWSSPITWYKSLFMAPKAAVQGTMIVLSPGTQSRNAFGAGLMFTAGGHLIQGNWADTISAIKEELFPGLSYDKNGKIKGDQEPARKMMRTSRLLGVSSTSPVLNDAFAIFNEMSSGKYDTLEKITHALYTLKHLDTDNAFSAAMTLPGYVVDKTVGSVFRFLKGTYAAVDDFFKILSFGANRIEIKNSLKRLSDAAVSNGAAPLSEAVQLKILRDYASTLTMNMGTYRSDAAVLYRNVTDLETYIDHLSAHIVRNTMPNYDYVGAFAKFWRKLPFGNFIAFPTEMMRTTGNLVQMQYKDATYKIPDSLMAEAGLPPEQAVFRGEDGKVRIKQLAQRPFHRKAVKRLVIGGGSVVGLPAAAVALGQVMFDIEDEDLEAANEIGAEYSKNATRMPSSPLREDGTGFDYFLMNYLFPYMFLNKQYNTIEYSIRNRDVQGEGLPKAVLDGFMEGVVQFAEDYYAVSIAPKVIAELINNETENNKQIYNPEDDLGEQATVILQYALDNAGPGGYRQARDIVKAFSEGDERFTKYGAEMEEITALLKLAGVTQSVADPNRSLPFYINNVKKAHDKLVKSNMDPVAWDRSKITEEYVLEQWRDSQETWFLIQQQLYMKLQAYKKLKVDDSVYREQVKRLGEIAGINAAQISRNLKKGIFTPWTLPPYIQKNFNKAKKELDLERTWPGREINQGWRELKDGKVSLLGSPYLVFPSEAD